MAYCYKVQEGDTIEMVARGMMQLARQHKDDVVVTTFNSVYLTAAPNDMEEYIEAYYWGQKKEWAGSRPRLLRTVTGLPG